MAIPSTVLSTFSMTLKEQAQDDQGIVDFGQLVDLIDIGKGSLATKPCQGQKIDVTIKLAIDILQIVVPLCVVDPIHRPMDTKRKSQGVWEQVFDTLFAKTVVNAVFEMKALHSTADEVEVMIGRELALQRLNYGSEDATPMSTFLKVRTFYTPKKNRSMPSPMK
ncbi:hypothetical protein KI688_002779 [Linnemannia hyalina]|uniref:Uncharacterized protein n=1 Tax=Linnemannia hyalina TaxID=64524 RepID=A0A9P7XRS3_9FUNG|nr:hypothetical protein KI688_002779 [Linnemannia hyalina]